MSVAEMAKNIGKEALLVVEGGELTIVVVITDVKVSFGNERMLIKPVNGTGTKWVSSDRLKMVD